MSILIKGMEMPKNCNTCNFHMLRFCCAADKDLAEKGTRPLIEHRPDLCPLVPVPPHGDLIDMNAKIDVYDRYDDDIIRPTTVRGLINEYISGGYPRAIIPAEEEKL